MSSIRAASNAERWLALIIYFLAARPITKRPQAENKIMHLLPIMFFLGTFARAEEDVASAGFKPPYVRPYSSVDGSVSTNNANHKAFIKVFGCCLRTSEERKTEQAENSCSDNQLAPTEIGSIPQMTSEDALSVLQSAKHAWNGGMGVWPQLSLKSRIEAIENFFEELSKTKREEIVRVLMWEIGKNRDDAEAEFDRTVLFVKQVIQAIRSPENSELYGKWTVVGATNAFVRRAAIGIILCLGPFNYPINETYSTLIPALLMGNIVILKIPTVGGLAHFLTMEAFAKALPAGTIHFISGSGRETMPPLMKTGLIDGLAFIGGASAADSLIKEHPHPHRLKVFLQLEGKNMAIFLSDIFQDQNAAALDHALNEAVVGSLSFNGQRCTALKILFVPREYALLFLSKLKDKVEALTVGLPWERSEKSYSQITPLPNSQRVAYMKQLIQDAVSKGASIVNANGGTVVGGPESTLMIPAVVFPVDDTMDLFSQEQFGPVVPVVPYDSIDTVLEYGRDGIYGQQCSIFTSEKDSDDTADILDRFSSIFGKININSQCGRSPDVLPFSGRRSSAMGVMSVTDALKEFSVPTVVSYKKDGLTELVMSKVEKRSQFLAKL